MTHIEEATQKATYAMLYWITVYSLAASLCFIIEVFSWGIGIDLCVGKRLIVWADPPLEKLLKGGTGAPTEHLYRALKALVWYVTNPPRMLLRAVCMTVLIVDRLKKQSA